MKRSSLEIFGVICTRVGHLMAQLLPLIPFTKAPGRYIGLTSRPWSEVA